MGKVLVVGLDGATFDILKPLAANGRLPHLAHILENGAWGKLASTVPPVTPAAWTSFFTGKNPGKHGIYDFQDIDATTYEFRNIRTDEHREKTIWQLLGEANLRSIIMDVPFTYPPKPLNGLMITGYGTPRTPNTVFTYPRDLADRLPAELRPEVKVALPTNKFDRSQAFIDDWIGVMNGRQQLVRHLMQTEEWDLFMLVFSITDNMAHVFWTYVDPAHPNYHKPEGETYREAFLHGYEMCDQLLGEMMELAGSDTTTIILSDHGFGSVRPRQYVMQRLFKGKYAFPGSSQSNGFSLKNQLMQTAVSTYNRFPFLREWVKGLRPQNRRAFKRTLRQVNLMPHTDNIDYGRSPIIPSNFGLRMWINDKERFPTGVVEPADKDKLIDELTEYLTGHRDPSNGRQIINRVYRGDNLYHGPFAHNAPDLVIEYANFYDPQTTDPPTNPRLEGGHTPHGIFLAYGPNVQTATVQDASLIDLAPTILHLFNQEIPPDMDGRVLHQIFSRDYFNEHPIRFSDKGANLDQTSTGQEYTPEEEEELNEQLRQLGYI